MPNVFVEGVGNVNFPDSMSPKEIEAEIKRMTAKPAKSDMGGLEAFGRGALQSVKDIGFGAKQLGAELGGAAGLVSPETVRGLREEQAQRAAEAKAFMGTGAGKAGYLAGSIGSMLIPGAALGRVSGAVGAAARGLSAPATFRGAAAGGGLLGALTPLEEGESRATSAAIGAAGGLIGQGISRGVSRVIQPSKSVPSPQAAKAVKRLQAEGIPVDLAEASGSENLRIVRRFLTDNPISAAAMRKGEEARQAAFNRAALKTIGEQGEAAIPEVLSRADQRIGSVMDDIAKNTRVKVPGKLLDTMAQVERDAAMILSDAEAGPLRQQLNNILSKIGDDDAIPGAAYQNARRLASQLSAKPGVSPLGRQLREALDEALQESVPKAQVDAIKTARKQYRNLMRIQESIGTTELGDISIPKLAAATSRKAERGAALLDRGDAELARLSRSANTLRESFPQSGTAPRAAIQYYGMAGAPLAAGAAYDLSQQGELSGASQAGLAAGALGLMGPAALRRAYQNPALRDYILRGIGSPAARQMLMGPTARGAMTYGPAAGLLSQDEE